jgi:Recombinase zinc beta ribbon domain
VRAASKTRKRTGVPTKHVLTGLLPCPKCGHSMSGGHQARARNGTLVVRYACRSTAYGTCGNASVSAAGIEAEVARQLVEWIDTDEFRKEIETALKATGNDDLGGLLEERDAKRNMLAKIKQQWRAGRLDDDDMETMTDDTKREIEELDARVERAAAAIPVHLVGEGDFLARSWDTVATFDEKRAFLTALVDRIELRDGKGGNRFDPTRVKVHFRYARPSGKRPVRANGGQRTGSAGARAST